jgi:hypothetical protein
MDSSITFLTRVYISFSVVQNDVTHNPAYHPVSQHLCVRFEVHSVVKMSMLVLWVVTPCGLVGAVVGTNLCVPHPLEVKGKGIRRVGRGI